MQNQTCAGFVGVIVNLDNQLTMTRDGPAFSNPVMALPSPTTRHQGRGETSTMDHSLAGLPGFFGWFLWKNLSSPHKSGRSFFSFLPLQAATEYLRKVGCKVVGSRTGGPGALGATHQSQHDLVETPGRGPSLASNFRLFNGNMPCFFGSFHTIEGN